MGGYVDVALAIFGIMLSQKSNGFLLLRKEADVGQMFAHSP